MPEVMLPHDWPGRFRRTVEIKGKSRLYEFHPGVPVELKPVEVEALRLDIGNALLPIERDEKNRPRVIREEVDQATNQESPLVTQAAG